MKHRVSIKLGTQSLEELFWYFLRFCERIKEGASDNFLIALLPVEASLIKVIHRRAHT